MIVRAAPPENVRWLIQQTGLVPALDLRVVEAVDASGRILGQIGAERWTDGAVMLHWAVAEPIALRMLLPEVARWIFVQGGRRVAIGVTPGDNGRALRLAKRIGFHELARIRDGPRPGVDSVILEMRAEECRWLVPARKVA
jgi:RimJ/RimL family protein N-acetyltransferase